MTDAPPKTPNGCWLVAGLVLAGAAGFAAAAGAGIAFNAPFPVVAGLMFGTPGLYLVALFVLAIRHMRRHGVDMTPEQQAAWPIVGTVLGAFGVVAGLSFGGVFVAWLLGAPGWVTPVVFFAPGVLFSFFAWPYLKALPERLRRAAPSPEKAAALAGAPPRRTEPTATPTDPDAFPTVPADPSDPGRTLARRLPPADWSAGCACVGVLAAAAFWNGIVSVFVWQAVVAVRKGNPEWFLMCFLVPFVLVGLVLVVVGVIAAAVWLIALLTGKVTVEVDAHPFVPGGTYRGRVEQTGPCRLRKVGVALVCTEAATYQAGTTESTDRKEVSKELAELPEPLPAAPTDFTLTVPADAMHSFEARKNKVEWKVTVWGRVLGVLPYERGFEVVVRPGGGDG
jgi:MFS family permease